MIKAIGKVMYGYIVIYGLIKKISGQNFPYHWESRKTTYIYGAFITSEYDGTSYHIYAEIRLIKNKFSTSKLETKGI